MNSRVLVAGFVVLSLGAAACFPDDPVRSPAAGGAGEAVGGGGNGAEGIPSGAGAGGVGAGGVGAGGGGGSGPAGGSHAAGASGAPPAVGGAAGATQLSVPGLLDCEAPQTSSAHRFCTDFAPGPSFWPGAACSQLVVEGGNAVFTWQEPMGTYCHSFVRYQLGGANKDVTAALWLRADQVGFADDEQAVMRVVMGDVSEETGLAPPGTPGGQIALRPARDAAGAITSLTLVLSSLGKGETTTLAPFPLAAWRYVRLRVTAEGAITGTQSLSPTDPGSSAQLTDEKAAAASAAIVFPFAHAKAAAQPTRLTLDEIVVDTR